MSKTFMPRYFLIFGLIILFTSCVKKQNQDQEDILLYLINQASSTPLRDACVSWSFTEWECVQDGNDRSKEVSILSECNQGRIEDFRNSLLPEESRADADVVDAYSCLKSCNRSFHLAIQCPTNLTFRSIEEYRKPRSESTSTFHRNWQICNLRCRIKGSNS